MVLALDGDSTMTRSGPDGFGTRGFFGLDGAGASASVFFLAVVVRGLRAGFSAGAASAVVFLRGGTFRTPAAVLVEAVCLLIIGQGGRGGRGFLGRPLKGAG